MVPKATVSATEEPDIPPKIKEARTLAPPKPPRAQPTPALENSINFWQHRRFH